MSAENKQKASELKIDYIDILDVVEVVTGTECEDYNELENNLLNRYNITVKNYLLIINDLWNLLKIGTSLIDGEPSIGFADKSMWLLKKDIQKEFINSLILWIGEGRKLKKPNIAFIKDITLKGEVEYQIVLAKPSECEIIIKEK